MSVAARAPVLRWAAVAVVAAAGAGAWYFLSGPDPTPPPDGTAGAEADPPDPRLTFETPFRNVRPDVHYVGDAACAGCHRTIDRTYHAHPMGRSAAIVAKAAPIERFGAAAHNPCPAGAYELWVETANGTQRHHVRAKDADGRALPEYVVTADVAIGSGTRGRSYVTVRDGEAWQTAISWYGPDARWDLSPGFDLGNGGRRAVVAECLFCHVDRVDPAPGAVNRYRGPFPTGQAAIGCERCHGPGELHVAERTAGPVPGPIDTSIVNPKHLDADLRSAICAQCHLQGEQRVARRGRSLFEFRPGLPLELFLTVFVRHPDAVDLQKSVGQFEQMRHSRCFTESAGRFGCTSCHDPHAAAPAPPVERAAYYRGKCAACHTGPGHECSEALAVRREKADACTACHMPRADSSNIIHASVTDHQVPRRPGPAAAPHHLPPGTIPIVPYPLGPHTSPEERDRDLGVALSLLALKAAADPSARGTVAEVAEEQLRSALARWPGDVRARLALAEVFQARGDWQGAFDAAAAAAARKPASVEAQAALAAAAAGVGRADTAVAAATELIRLSPSGVDPLLLRAGIYMQQGEWAKAEADCRAALTVHPLHPQVRLYLGICRHRLGDPAGGKREAETAAGLATNPHQRAGLMDLYRAQTR
jgi:hypothetical protein